MTAKHRVGQPRWVLGRFGKFRKVEALGPTSVEDWKRMIRAVMVTDPQPTYFPHCPVFPEEARLHAV